MPRHQQETSVRSARTSRKVYLPIYPKCMGAGLERDAKRGKKYRQVASMNTANLREIGSGKRNAPTLRVGSVVSSLSAQRPKRVLEYLLISVTIKSLNPRSMIRPRKR